MVKHAAQSVMWLRGVLPEPEEESGYAFDYYEVGETPVSCAAIFSQFEKMYAVSSNSNNA